MGPVWKGPRATPLCVCHSMNLGGREPRTPENTATPLVDGPPGNLAPLSVLRGSAPTGVASLTDPGGWQGGQGRGGLRAAGGQHLSSPGARPTRATPPCWGHWNPHPDRPTAKLAPPAPSCGHRDTPRQRCLYLEGGDIGALGGDVSEPVQEVLARNPDLVEHGEPAGMCGALG